MRRGIIAAAGLSLTLTGAAVAEEGEVYYCADEQAEAIAWKKPESGNENGEPRNGV